MNVSDSKDTTSDRFVKIFELSSKSTFLYYTMHNMLLILPIRCCVWGSEIQLGKCFLCTHQDLTLEAHYLSEKWRNRKENLHSGNFYNSGSGGKETRESLTRKPIWSVSSMFREQTLTKTKIICVAKIIGHDLFLLCKCTGQCSNPHKLVDGSNFGHER